MLERIRNFLSGQHHHGPDVSSGAAARAHLAHAERSLDEAARFYAGMKRLMHSDAQLATALEGECKLHAWK